METIDVDYGSLKRYDTTKPPLRQRIFFTAVLRALIGQSMIRQPKPKENIGK